MDQLNVHWISPDATLRDNLGREVKHYECRMCILDSKLKLRLFKKLESEAKEFSVFF